MAGRGKRRPLPDTEFSADIVDLAQDGRGIARVEGKVTFIHGALPGERVQFKLAARSRDIDEGYATAIEQPSADRVTPACAHFDVCGGCAMQHLSPEGQRRFKQKQMLDALSRIGGVTPETVAEPIVGPTWGYRRKARLGAKKVPKKGGVLVGFRERQSAFLAAIKSCEVLDPRVGHAIESLAACLNGLSIADQIPQVEVATADPVALVLRVLSEPSAEDLDALKAYAAEHSVEFYLQRGGPATVQPLGEVHPLHYAPLATRQEQLHFGPLDFVQINSVVSQAMVQQALDWLDAKPGDRVLELFAGLGNFTIPLAASGAVVTAVEGDDELVRKGAENLACNGLHARFLKADLFLPASATPGKPAPDLAWLQDPYDLVLLDPPRSGAKEILPHVAAVKPARIVYVSCHPGTLARDAGELVKTYGYRLVRAGIMDMFPHTAHVESMAVFVRD